MAPPDPIADDGSVTPPFFAIALVSAAVGLYGIAATAFWRLPGATEPLIQ